MSEQEALELEVDAVETEEEVAEVNPALDLVNALQAGEFNAADQLFKDILGDKVQATLDAEKIAVAGQIFNGEPAYDEDFTEDEVEYGEEAAEFGSAEDDVEAEADTEVEAELEEEIPEVE